MKFYGIVGVAHKLMESYLRNRYQRVTINACIRIKGYFSKWEEVQHGVPQGSVLGPLLFLIQGGAEPTDTFQMVIDNIWKQGKISETVYKYVQVRYLLRTDYKLIF